MDSSKIQSRQNKFNCTECSASQVSGFLNYRPSRFNIEKLATSLINTQCLNHYSEAYPEVLLFTNDPLNKNYLKSLNPFSRDIRIVPLYFENFFNHISTVKQDSLVILLGEEEHIDKDILMFYNDLAQNLFLFSSHNINQVESYTSVNNYEYLTIPNSSRPLTLEERAGRYFEISFTERKGAITSLKDPPYEKTDETNPGQHINWNLVNGLLREETHSEKMRVYGSYKINSKYNSHIDLCEIITSKLFNSADKTWSEYFASVKRLIISSPFLIISDEIIRNIKSKLPNCEYITNQDFIATHSWSPSVTLFKTLVFESEPFLYLNVGSYPDIYFCLGN